jgi:glycyl-tRNA synthetase beta chain
MADFLFEIGLEEVPARMIAAAEAELSRRVEQLLLRERLLSEAYSVQSFSTPRRLAVLIAGVVTGQADIEEQLTGPSWKVAFNNDAPTPAAIAFAKKAGVEVTALEKVITPKGEYVGAIVKRAGRATSEILAASLPAELTGIYWAKNMYWRLNKPERFVRPVRWLVALLDEAIVPVEFGGISAGNTTRGHRILHGEAPVVISKPADYLQTLRTAYVDADVAARRHTIRKALDRVTREVPGARWREDEALVESVVHLTEWPTVLLGSFEPEYLSLPEEVLVTVMRDHQKYFAIEDTDGKLAPYFLTVLNTEVDDLGRAIIRHGNERVLRSRFKDAQFFWEADQKTPLTERVDMLNAVTFQKELGSYHWKTEGNLRIAEKLASAVQAKGKILDKVALLQASLLAKTDLTAELVKEFTELQGIIGGLYAKAQGLGDTVANAIYSQYTPASIEDAIPETIEGQLLGIADRIQTIVAMFGIGAAPTGSRDPFALRRNANAIIKILAESDLPLTLGEVVSISGAESDAVPSFLAERLSFYLKDVRGFAYDVVSAVLAAGSDDVRDAIARAEALTAARNSEDFVAISAAFKRIKNILRQASEKNEILAARDAFSGALLESEERSLHSASTTLAAKVAPLREAGNYAAALEAIATLRPAVDAFFEKVMVMAPEPELRAARLALIQSVLDSFSGIADFSDIVTA